MYTSVYDIAWRIFLVGLGLGPSLPLLNLAVQNAAPRHQIGAVTANRQFFQQLGQALGGAVFGVVLTTTLTTQLQQHFTQIAPSLPPAAQAALDPARFRNSVGEGSGQQVDLRGQIAAAALVPLNQQRTLTQAALGQGDADARTQLLGSPDTLPEVRAELQASTGADAQALVRASRAIDVAEQGSQQQAQALGQRVHDAVRESYATSITQIYVYAFWLSIVALVVIVLWLPEIPLSKGNRAEAPLAVE
jgi:hypothetical protein